MSKVLLVDTNVSSEPIFSFLIEKGFDVFVVGRDPDDYLAKVTKNYIEADYSDKQALTDIFVRGGFHFLVPGCNDLSYKICSELSQRLRIFGIESTETTDILNNKERFRSFANEYNIPSPRIINHKNYDWSGPVIVKPVDAYSGRGVTIVQNQKSGQILDAIEKAQKFSKSGSIVIEEFVEGQLFSHSAFITGGEIVIDFFVEEHCTANSFVVDTSKVVFDFDESLKENIRSQITRIAKILKLKDGLVHTQFIKEKNDFWFIEITRRCPGDLYSHLIEFSTGFPYAATYSLPFISEKIHIDKQKWHPRRIIRHTVSRPENGYFKALNFKYSVKIEKIIQLCKSGDFIKGSPFGRIALLFVECENENNQNATYRKFLERELYQII